MKNIHLFKEVCVKNNVIKDINMYRIVFVLNNVMVIMLIQKVEIFVIILVTIIKLQNNINNVYNNAQIIIISFINIIIDMNVLKNVINIHIKTNNNKQYVHKK